MCVTHKMVKIFKHLLFYYIYTIVDINALIVYLFTNTLHHKYYQSDYVTYQFYNRLLNTTIITIKWIIKLFLHKDERPLSFTK